MDRDQRVAMVEAQLELMGLNYTECAPTPTSTPSCRRWKLAAAAPCAKFVFEGQKEESDA